LDSPPYTLPWLNAQDRHFGATVLYIEIIQDVSFIDEFVNKASEAQACGSR
jgi:hypothetical protein